MPTHTTLDSLFSDIADSIRAKTGSEEIIIADNFPSEINNIETGGEIGKNLLRGTGKLTKGTGEWTTGTFRASGASFGSTWNVETINDSPVPGIVTAFTLKANSSEKYPGFAQDYYPMTGHIGDKLTYSVWAKGAAGSDIVLQPFWSGTAGESESASQTFTLTDSNWTYFEYTTPALQYNHSELSIGYIYTNSTTKIYITGLMLEFGEKATAWMPAKEDLINIGDSTAAAGDVLSSKVFYTNIGTRTTGTIASKSSNDSTISNNVVSVPSGYYATSFTKTVGTSRSGSDLTASGATVSVPAGYYASSASKAIGSGSATTPNTTISVTPTISVGSDAKITVSVSGTKSVTPTVSAGYVSSGAAGTITVSGSNTSQMTLRNSNSLTVSNNTVSAPAGYYASAASKAVGTVKAAATYYATTADQSISSGYYLTGAQTIKALSSSNFAAANIKSGVTISVSNGSTSVYSAKGTAGIRYAYQETLSPAGTKTFYCASSTGATQVSLYYVSFNPGFKPTTVLISSSAEDLRRSLYEGSKSTYAVVFSGATWWACTNYTMTANSVIMPIGNVNEQVYVRAFA